MPLRCAMSVGPREPTFGRNRRSSATARSTDWIDVEPSGEASSEMAALGLLTTRTLHGADPGLRARPGVPAAPVRKDQDLSSERGAVHLSRRAPRRAGVAE